MKPFQACLTIPASLALLISQASGQIPTAIRKLAPNPNEKILAEHLAFAPLPFLSPRGSLDSDGEDEAINVNGSASYLPAYARHFSDGDRSLLRRASEALAILQRRDSCPIGTNSCSSVNEPNKCCQDGTYCASVEDGTVGGVACCPNGKSCGGTVGACPAGATSCSQELGGGCCISGYVCEGLGCVPSASATRIASTSTWTSSTTQLETTTATTTTKAASSSSTSSTTSTSTSTTEETTQPQTKSASETTATETLTSSATGGAPLRPIPSDITTGSTQTGCPTGYYGCLATHGGGCCRTDRNCNIHDCPASSTTIVVTHGPTIIVVEATDAPPAPNAISTCADGWFLCGLDAGPVSGCCPTGYKCGTASCFTATASHTESIQKQFPDAGDLAPGRDLSLRVLGGFVAAACFLIAI
ncbi:hypothetical protein BGZ63DRAFT_423678 [Mariannaea sp. PMI_226]|nr:hypothetical protein BGZ63DRAFT_423678 [Mariannaea sp. PMI_226]